MPQAKDKLVACHIEEDFYSMVGDLAQKRNMSISAYIRMLIIEDLRQSGLVTTETLARVVAG